MELYVNDLIPKKTEEMKFLFLLESPYTNEVFFQCPLAGRTGKSITNFFIKESININIPEDTPFGLFLKNYNDENRFGVMNCSTTPLDKKVYQDLELDIDEIIIALDRIRRRPKTKMINRNSKLDKSFHHTLYQCFKSRLLSYHEKSNKFIIISCGSLAKAFLKEESEFISTDIKSHEILYVPHPSFGWWARIKYRDEINKMIESLKNNL